MARRRASEGLQSGAELAQVEYHLPLRRQPFPVFFSMRPTFREDGGDERGNLRD